MTQEEVAGAILTAASQGVARLIESARVEATHAERERCAKLAERMFPVPDDVPTPRGSWLAHGQQAAHQIAAAIREGT